MDGAAAIAMTSTSPYLLAFTPNTGAPTGFIFTAQAVSTGSHTIQVEDTTNSIASNTISITAALASSGNLPAFRIQANTAMAVGSPITLGHFFAKGDFVAPSVPYLIATTTGGQTARVQVDQTNTWLADGSLRFAALSFLSPIAFTAGQVASFQLGISSVAISGSPITTSQIMAAGDFSIQVQGGADYGGSTTISGASAPSANAFTGVNTSTLTTSGGSSSPLVLSQTYGTSNNAASQVEAFSGSAQTVTAIVQVANFVGYAEGGLTLRNSGSGQQAHFAVFCPNGGPLQLQVEGFSNPTTDAGGIGSPTTGLSYLNGPFFLRISFDGSNYTFLASPSGAANSWTQVAQEPAATVYSPNQVGLYLCANDAGVTPPGNATLTVSDWEVTPGANPQGAASASITTTTVAFAASAQDVLANFTQSIGLAGWGTNYPLAGWEMIRSGPICSEFRAWRYLKRASDGASHAQVKAKLYIRAWSDGQGGIQGYEPLAGLFQENSYGPHPSGTVGTTLQRFQVLGATVNHGGTQAASFGALYTNPQRGWWGALSDGSRPWVGVNGAAKPSYLVAHDQAYAIGTRCLPPYDIGAAAALTAAGVSMNIVPSQAGIYAPNTSNFSNSLTPPGAINATGDPQYDHRYGYLNVDATALFLNPLDQLRRVSVLADGWQWADWECWICDERTGWPVNTGTDSTTCPSPANPTFEMYSNQNIGSPAFWNYCNSSAFPGTYHQFNYGPRFDFSHIPSLWIMPYLITADAAFEETALFQSSTAFACTDQGGRNFTLNYGGSSRQRHL